MKTLADRWGDREPHSDSGGSAALLLGEATHSRAGCYWNGQDSRVRIAASRADLIPIFAIVQASILCPTRELAMQVAGQIDLRQARRRSSAADLRRRSLWRSDPRA